MSNIDSQPLLHGNSNDPLCQYTIAAMAIDLTPNETRERERALSYSALHRNSIVDQGERLDFRILFYPFL